MFNCTFFCVAMRWREKTIFKTSHLLSRKIQNFWKKKMPHRTRKYLPNSHDHIEQAAQCPQGGAVQFLSALNIQNCQRQVSTVQHLYRFLAKFKIIMVRCCVNSKTTTPRGAGPSLPITGYCHIPTSSVNVGACRATSVWVVFLWTGCHLCR